MTNLPFQLSEHWRPFLAVGLAVILFLLISILIRLLTRRLFKKNSFSFRLTALFAALATAAFSFYDKPWVDDLFAILIVCLVTALWTFFDRFYFAIALAKHKKVKVPNILRQIIQLLVLLITVALVLTHMYEVKITGLLATSGVAAVILGFAMQDLLANIIAGFSIHMTKSFKVGDWLIIEATGERAEVKEVNWRATRLLNNDEISFELPNSELVKARIVNLNYPTREHGVRLRIGLDYDQPPNRVKEILLSTVTGTQGILEKPVPVVLLIEFGDSAIIYEIRFWMRSPRLYNTTCDELRTKIWYALHHHNIQIPFPITSIERRTPNKPSAFNPDKKVAASILSRDDCMPYLSELEIEKITENSSVRLYAKGDLLVRQGEPGSSMFIIIEGSTDIFIKTPDGGSEKVHTLEKASFFGELSLLTGEKRSATVRCAEDALIMEIQHAVISPIIKENSALLESMSELLARRQEETLEVLEKLDQQHSQALNSTRREATSENFLSRIRTFFY